MCRAKIVSGTYRVHKTKILIRMVLRVEDGRKILKTVVSKHHPFHYLASKYYPLFKKLHKSGRIVGAHRTRKVRRKNFVGYQIFYHIPKQVAEAREVLRKHKVLEVEEADFPYFRRWQTDLGIKSYIAISKSLLESKRVNWEDWEIQPIEAQTDFGFVCIAFDIETTALNPEDGEITAIVFVLPNGKIIRITQGQAKDGFKYQHPNEALLLKDTVKIFKSGDIFYGFHSENFDWPWLETRFKVHRERDKSFPVFPGTKYNQWCHHIDIQKLYLWHREAIKDPVIFGYGTAGLDYIAKEELGIGKVPITRAVKWYWLNKPKIFLKYLHRDGVLNKKLEDKMDLVKRKEVRGELEGVTFKHVMGMYSGIDTMIMRRASQSGKVLPSGKSNSELMKIVNHLLERGELDPQIYEMYIQTGKFPGGYIKEPSRAAKFPFVGVCDFTSLYNRVMQVFNICITTVESLKKARKVKIKRNGEITEDIRPTDSILLTPRPKIAHTSIGDLRFDSQYYQAFSKEERGIIPLELEDLEKARNFYKSNMLAHDRGSDEYKLNNGIQLELKGLILSFYGLTGASFGRYFDLRMASAVTLAAQFMTKASIAFIEGPLSKKLGFQLVILYGDTDSVFILLPVKTIEEAVKLTTVINKEMNKFYWNLLDRFGVPEEWKQSLDPSDPPGTCRIEMKIEKIYAPLLFGKGATASEVRKRYTGLAVAVEKRGYVAPVDIEKELITCRSCKTTNKKSWLGDEFLCVKCGEDEPNIYEYVDITGMQAINRSFPDFVKKVHKHTILLILLNKTKEEIMGYINRKIAQMWQGRFDNDLIQGTKIKQLPEDYKIKGPHVRAAMILRDRHKQIIYPGDMILYIWTEKDVYPVVNGKLLKKPRYEKYEKDLILKPLNRLIDTVFPKVERRVKSLDDFR